MRCEINSTRCFVPFQRIHTQPASWGWGEQVHRGNCSTPPACGPAFSLPSNTSPAATARPTQKHAGTFTRIASSLGKEGTARRWPVSPAVWPPLRPHLLQPHLLSLPAPNRPSSVLQCGEQSHPHTHSRLRLPLEASMCWLRGTESGVLASVCLLSSGGRGRGALKITALDLQPLPPGTRRVTLSGFNASSGAQLCSQ